VRSLWFRAGSFYTLNGSGTIELNSGTPTGHVLVVTNDVSAPKQSETNIESDIKLNGSFGGQDNRARIENWSEGGLRIGGLFKSADFNVQFGGTGAIHLAGRITNHNGERGNSNFYVQGSAGTEENVHVILSADNDGTFGGVLRVNDRGFLIVKKDQALGEGSNKVVNLGGTIGLRSQLKANLTYKKPGQNNYIGLYGDGIVRIAGTTKRIGALYNDGGWNSLEMRMDQTTPETRPTGFGSRGDRGGGLELRNQVRLTTEFHKLGPGLIVLNNVYGGGDSNQWDKDTHLKAGVLRIANANSLPSNSNIIFAGGIHGGILELGYGTTPFNYSLGTGGGAIRWTGDGGFSAFGGARSVTINGGALIWGQQYFVQDSYALLLSSRYADDVITFTNAINLNGQQREVRVERGDRSAAGVDAHAILSGALSGDGGGLRKTGDGLLRLTGTNTYTGATRIEAGALLGAVGNTTSNIVLAGGVRGLDADFTRGLGGGGAQIQWSGHGGFAAYDGNRTVNIGNSGASLTWGTDDFVQNGQELRFGHYTADGTVLWDNALALGSDARTIRIERAEANKASGLADVALREAISGTGTLNLLGDGRIDLTADNSALSSTINIYGAELRLHGAGKLAGATKLDIRHGGQLVLNNASGSVSGRLKQTVTESGTTTLGAAITLAAGTLKLDSAANAISEKIGDLTLEAGANEIELTNDSASTELHINELKRSGDERATLDITGDLNDTLLSFKVTTDASGHAKGGIIPWATANGSDWLTAETNGSLHYLRLLTSYQTSFNTGNNVKVSGTGSFSGNQTINSLNLQGNLSMGGNLTLSSGGLLSTGAARTINGSGSIATGGILPLYIHTQDNLTFSDTARINVGSNTDIVKTLGGSLILDNSSATTIHQARDLYIYQGTVELRQGGLQVRRIIIGDGAGEDKLILPGSVWNPVTGHDSELPSITLRGTPYDPRGPEYSGDQAILQLGGNGPYGAGTKQRLSELRIEGRGTIDWRGGEVGLANILWIESLSFSSTSDILFIRNWYEYEDLFLVRKEGFHSSLLPQIVFEGYQDYETTWKAYDDTYIQITPFGKGGYLPEPSTYGVILGAMGLGLWGWRKRTQRLGLRPRRCAQSGSDH